MGILNELLDIDKLTYDRFGIKQTKIHTITPYFFDSVVYPRTILVDRAPLAIAGKTNPFESMVEATLIIIKRKPICPYPPNGGPSSGISRQGPILRNFAIPKAAVRTDEENVNRNMVLLL